MKKLASSLLWCALLLQAEFQPSHWKDRRPLPAGTATPMAVWNVDRGTYVHAQPGLADLRVVRGEEEVPYVLERLSGWYRRMEVASGAFNQGVSPAGELELTVDVGRGRRHNGIRLATPKSNFRQRVSIQTSDDGKRWLRVRDDGYIFDFSADQRHISVLAVTYPVSSRRYVRVAVHGWKDPKAVSQCWVTFEETQAPVRDVMASLKPDPRPDPQTQSVLYTWDLGVSGIPYDQLSLDAGTAEFQRAALVETSDDGKIWLWSGQGVLSRFPNEQSLALDFPEKHARYLRLRVYNGDDRPLEVNTAALSVIRTRVKFKADGGGDYWLYYGNADAHTPSYDLPALLARETPGPETGVSAGPEEHNPAYREKPVPAKPWSERHPEILYLTLALAVAGMGIATVRFLRKVNAESR